jgi:multiple sugar transport system substrate-binding protein
MRRTTWTRVAVAAVVAAMALTGCGREADDGSRATEAESVEEGKATGSITVWALGAEGEQMGEIAKGFEKANPDAKVKVTVIPFDAAHDKLATAIAGGETPDVSLVGTTWLSEFAASDAFDPTPTDLVDQDAFYDGAWDTTVVDGTSYGVPWYVETRLIYYRQDLAKQAGVTPGENWTWEEFKEFTRAMQSEAGAEWGISLQPGRTGSWQSVMPFAWQAGAELVEGDQFQFDSEPMQKAVDFYTSFFDEGLSPTDLDPASGALESGFIDGDIGSFISGPWHMGILRDQGGEEFEGKWSVAHMPTDKNATSFVGGSDLVVFKDSENRDTAWKFVDYLTQVPAQQQLYQLVGSLPAVPDAWQGELADDPMLEQFGTQLEDARSAPAVPTWEQAVTPLDNAIERVAKGQQDTATALAEANEKANAIGTGG